MRLYTVNFNNVSISASQDLFGILTTANMAIKLHWLELGQKTLTSWEAKEVQIIRNTGTVSAGSGGNAFTPSKVNPGDAAATATARINDTTSQSQTGGASTVLFSREWELLNGFFWMPAPEQRPIFGPSSGLQIKLGTGPSAAMTASGTAMFEELY